MKGDVTEDSLACLTATGSTPWIVKVALRHLTIQHSS